MTENYHIRLAAELPDAVAVLWDRERMNTMGQAITIEVTCTCNNCGIKETIKRQYATPAEAGVVRVRNLCPFDWTAEIVGGEYWCDECAGEWRRGETRWNN